MVLCSFISRAKFSCATHQTKKNDLSGIQASKNLIVDSVGKNASFKIESAVDWYFCEPIWSFLNFVCVVKTSKHGQINSLYSWKAEYWYFLWLIFWFFFKVPFLWFPTRFRPVTCVSLSLVFSSYGTNWNFLMSSRAVENLAAELYQHWEFSAGRNQPSIELHALSVRTQPHWAEPDSCAREQTSSGKRTVPDDCLMQLDTGGTRRQYSEYITSYFDSSTRTSFPNEPFLDRMKETFQWQPTMRGFIFAYHSYFSF